MATSPDNWYRDNKEQIPAPGSWHDVDQGEESGLSGCLFVTTVTTGLIVIAVVAMLMAVYWH